MSEPTRTRATLFTRPPALWIVIAGLAGVFFVAHGAWLQGPFFGDDFLLLDRLRGVSLLGALRPVDPALGYRPWSQGVHFWALSHFAGVRPLPYHIACGVLWLAVMSVYFALVRRLAGATTATLAVCGAATLAAWAMPIEWAAGAQDLWMLLASLAALLAFAHRRNGWAAAALAVALASKETAAVVPAIAVTLAVLVDNDRPGVALRRIVPMIGVLILWVVVHPALGGHLWWARSTAAGATVGIPGGLGRSLLALVNLDLAPAPLSGWIPALGRALIGAVILAALAAWAVVARRTAEPSDAHVVRFGLTWAVLGWLTMLVAPAAWQPHFVLLAALGAWIALAIAMQRLGPPAVALVLVLALLGGARADTLARTPGNVRLLHINQGFLSHMESSFKNRFPVLRRYTRMFFTGIPSTAEVIRSPGDSPALRVWFADSTVRGALWSQYTPRAARDSIGGDYFFRLDSLAGWVEVTAGIENVRASRGRNPHWVADHERLALILAQSGSLRSAAEEYVKLSSEDNTNVDYAYLVGLCLEGLADTLGAAQWYGHAAALPGADPQTRAKANQWAALAARRR